MKYVSILIFLFSFSILKAQNQFIPQPKFVEIKKGEFIIPETLLISKDLPIEESKYLIERLKNFIKIEISDNEKAHFKFIPINKLLSNEEYFLRIQPEGIFVNYSSNQSYFYALQTLAQLLEEHKTAQKIPVMDVLDEPKFKWRGMHLDVVRHFFTVEEVKKYLDYLAFYKINRFHWHLTDDQGWRIEIKKYPKLTEIGSKRKETMT